MTGRSVFFLFPRRGKAVRSRIGRAGPAGACLGLAFHQIGAQCLGQPRLAVVGGPVLRFLPAFHPIFQHPGSSVIDSEKYGAAMSANGFSQTSTDALRLPVQYGRSPAIASCGSSVVEHSLGKGEVESSILSRSTILIHNSVN